MVLESRERRASRTAWEGGFNCDISDQSRPVAAGCFYVKQADTVYSFVTEFVPASKQLVAATDAEQNRSVGGRCA